MQDRRVMRFYVLTCVEKRDDRLKQTPCLVPYEQLSETEKDYDRNTARETLKLIVKLGFKISW